MHVFVCVWVCVPTCKTTKEKRGQVKCASVYGAHTEYTRRLTRTDKSSLSYESATGEDDTHTCLAVGPVLQAMFGLAVTPRLPPFPPARLHAIAGSPKAGRRVSRQGRKAQLDRFSHLGPGSQPEVHDKQPSPMGKCGVVGTRGGHGDWTARFGDSAGPPGIG